jgi:3,4-dihydroxy 2-butanone 4-phosphate synthase
MRRNNLLSSFGSSTERVEQAIKALQKGKGVLLIDNEDRENEGDLIFAAEKIKPEQTALMIRYCSGIICLCLTQERAKKLNLPPMVKNNTSQYGTAFTVSIEAAEGVTTGVSASDRTQTIRQAIAPNATPKSLNHPGHVFPLIAQPNGVFEREGHTEGSIDLMKIAKLSPYAVLCELTNDDGTMAKLPEIVKFSKQMDYPVLTIQDIKKYRCK